MEQIRKKNRLSTVKQLTSLFLGHIYIHKNKYLYLEKIQNLPHMYSPAKKLRSSQDLSILNSLK